MFKFFFCVILVGYCYLSICKVWTDSCALLFKFKISAISCPVLSFYYLLELKQAKKKKVCFIYTTAGVDFDTGFKTIGHAFLLSIILFLLISCLVGISSLMLCSTHREYNVWSNILTQHVEINISLSLH